MTTQIRAPAKQRGVTLIVGLIMMVLITVMVTTAFTLSKTNLKSVGNMQFRNEAIAAGNKAIEQVVGSWSMTTAPVADQINVDIDNDGSTDYVVDIAVPVCVSAMATTLLGDESSGSECEPLPDATVFCPPPTSTSIFTVVWDIDATVTGVSGGAKVRVRQGMSKSLSQAECNTACPPASGSPCV
jgi:Tfp pilus assembly protein PilX